MTEQKIKKILEIQEWSEVKQPEQFFKLMNYYYDLAPGVREKLLSKIPDINGLTEKFKQYCAAEIVEYEPSIVMVLSKLVDDITAVLGESRQVRGPEKRAKLSYLYSVFSEWFGDYGEVQCRLGSRDFVCNIAEAVEIARENQSADEDELSMMLITKERLEINARLEEKSLSEYEIDLDFLEELLGEEPSLEILNKNFKHYIH